MNLLQGEDVPAAVMNCIECSGPLRVISVESYGASSPWTSDASLVFAKCEAHSDRTYVFDQTHFEDT
jgi:hypothetical protein